MPWQGLFSVRVTYPNVKPLSYVPDYQLDAADSMASTIFDASSYLSQLDPGVSYSCRRLTGGVVNVTVRAVKHAEDLDKGRFRGHSSIILKYAPPFVAGRGEEAPMTQYRQTIEARALSLFSPDTPASLHRILQTSSVTIPAVLSHDPVACVLVIADLGRLPNLSALFDRLGGHAIGVETPWSDEGQHFSSTQDADQSDKSDIESLFLNADQQLTDDQEEFFRDVGSRLGLFFARLHHPGTCACILSNNSLKDFQLPEMREVVLEFVMKPIAGLIKLFPDLAGNDEADSLGLTLMEDFKRETLEDERSFVLGDTWTGAVLIDPKFTTSKKEPRTLGVIDWEFATFGRGVHGDMAQFLAHFELLREAAGQSPQLSKYRAAVDLMVASMTSEYSQSAFDTDEDKSWHLDLTCPEPSSLKAKTLRSAFLSHGAESINVAFWKHWVCLDPNCTKDESGEHTEVQHDCALIRRMVAHGLWYLRHARRDVEAFCEDSNWSDIAEDTRRKRKSGEKSMVDFF